MEHLKKILNSPSLPLVLCTFLRACGTVGVSKSIGIYLEDISISLGTTSTDIGIALGLFGAFYFVPAPLIAAIYRRPSVRRPLFIIGACLPATGVALVSMATSNAQIAVFLSLSGFGNCISMICTNMALHQVAGKNYNLIFSLGLTGGGFGMVLLPFVAEVLHETYGWRGGLLIMSALMAHIVPSAVAVKSESQNGFKSVPKEEEEEDCCGIDKSQTKGDDEHPVGFYRCITDSLRQSDFYVDPVINVLLLVSFLFHMVYTGWHSFLVPRSLQRGISVRNTIIMTLTASMGNIFSRISVGVLTNYHFSPVSLHIVSTLVNIVAIVCDALFGNFYAILMTSCFSAMSVGSRAILGALILRERVSPLKFDVAFSVNECISGLGMFIGGYLSGMIADRFSSFGATFKLLAVIDVIVLLLITIIRCNPKQTST